MRWKSLWCIQYIENFLTNHLVKEFWKLVHICQSYQTPSDLRQCISHSVRRPVASVDCWFRLVLNHYWFDASAAASMTAKRWCPCRWNCEASTTWLCLVRCQSRCQCLLSLTAASTLFSSCSTTCKAAVCECLSVLFFGWLIGLFIRWPTSANLHINAVTTQQYVVLWKTHFPQHNILLCCELSPRTNYWSEVVT